MYEIDFSKENKYLFLIGNGLNIAMGNDKCSWDKVLWNIANTDGRKSLFSPEHKPLLSSLETFNAIQLKSEHTIFSDKIVPEIKKIKFKADKNPSLLKFAEKNNVDILTTNFDMNIERYLWNCNYEKLKFSHGGFYPWRKYYSAADFCSQSDSKTRVWHIHGDITQNRSILFSMTRYMRAARKAAGLLNDDKNDHSALKQTWMWEFFSRPLIIAGLALSEQEIFLRWLLLERLMSARRLCLQSDLPQSYYLYRDPEEVEKLSVFLKMVNITPVYMGKKIFDNPIWDTDKEVITLPEIEK